MKPTLLLFAFLLPFVYSGIAQSGGPPIVWKKFFGGSRDERANSIINTYDGGFLLAGTAKSNNYDLTAHYGSIDSTDAWLVKLDENGNLEWQKNYGGTGEDEFIQVIHTADQGYLALGGTRTVDNGDVSGFHVSPQYNAPTYFYQNWDIWLVKTNREGDIVWQRCLGGGATDRAAAIRQTPDGGFIMLGRAGSSDGDLASIGSGSAWVVKLDGAGNIEWQNTYRESDISSANDIRLKPDGGYIIVGRAEVEVGPPPFPPEGSGTQGVVIEISNTGAVVSSSNRGTRGFLRAVVPNMNGSGYKYIGDYITCGAAKDNYMSSTTIETAGGSFIFGGCRIGEYPFTWYTPLGTDIMLQNPDGRNIIVGAAATGPTSTYDNLDGFVAGFNDPTRTGDTNSIWRIRYGGNQNEAFTGIVPAGENYFVVAGYAESYEDDFAGKPGGADFWVVKYGPANTIKGTVFLDRNSNGVKDTDESFVDNVMVQAQKDTVTYATRPGQGLYYFTVDTGSYTVSIPSPPTYYTALPATRTASFAGYGLTDSIGAFALQPISNQRDYQVEIVNYSAVRPGFNAQLWFTYANVGTDTLTNRPVRFIKDSRMEFVSAMPAQTSISGDTITWNIAQLLPDASGMITVWLKAAEPPALNNGDIVKMSVVADTTGDVNQSNNTAFTRLYVTGSFDPNDKQEAHGSTLFRNEYDAGDWLTYTIRFQNTGTDTAFNIVIRDTLTDKLVGNSLEMVAASHPYKLLLKDNKYISWTFNNILLVDSNRNEPASHGFVTFRVKPVNGLAVNDKITNTAAIYFDYNLPVITNTHETVLKATPVPAPDQPVVTGLQATYCSTLGVQKGKISNLPAAGGATTATVKLDNATLPIAADSSFAFKVDTLTAGQHQVVVTFTNATATKTYTFDFTVTAAVTPEVNVTANITNVVNLTNTVIVTATNAAGGGTAPLYTFAKDKAFTNIMQAEGAGAVLNIDPATLTIGDNKIYVRMKTSATCYTVQTNIDSILIRRDAATGIVDPANPGQVITVAPNPFGSEITVKGLNSGKAYRMVVFNSRGQAMYTSDVKNKSVVTIPAGKIPAGVYWLSVYDEKRKLLGTEKLIKY